MKRTLSVLFALMMIALLAVGLSARDNCTVEVPYFNVKPTIDGNFSIDEWGQPTASAIVYCGRNDYKYDDNDNVLVSDYCFYDGRAMYTADISFDLWLRWDEQYFYIGMVSKDQYGYAKAPSNYGDDDDPQKYIGLWNGDVLQFGLDAAGANSTGNAADPFINGASPKTFVMGYLDDELTTVALRNDANRRELIQNFKGAIQWHPEVWPTIGGQENKDAGYIVYELALPYAGFMANIEEGKTNGFGVTVARVSATPADATDKDGNIIGTGEYDCWLSWGDGVMGSLKDQLPEYRCGSNCAILVDTPAIGAGAAEAPEAVTEPAAAEEPEEAPEAEEPEDAEADAEAEAEETEENTEEVTEEAENAEETEAEKAEEETEAEKADDAEDPADAEEETKADSGDKAIDAGDGEDEAKSGLPVGAIIGIIAAVVVIAAVVIAVLAKKKK